MIPFLSQPKNKKCFDKVKKELESGALETIDHPGVTNPEWVNHRVDPVETPVEFRSLGMDMDTYIVPIPTYVLIYHARMKNVDQKVYVKATQYYI